MQALYFNATRIYKLKHQRQPPNNDNLALQLGIHSDKMSNAYRQAGVASLNAARMYINGVELPHLLGYTLRVAERHPFRGTHILNRCSAA